MPADEYAPVVRGALKLKGSAPSGINKKKKKKPKTSDPEASNSKKSALQSALEEEDAQSSKVVVKGKGEDGAEELDEEALRELEERGGDGKTASERAYDEMRRKRLHDRLQKEGVKTHKQRVEELNKYLSNLSEHHDMPRIGPG
ncbi:hypothetical protein ONS95_002512 [Cadophora gregata]|uniref:uncharacterized protein n=1 Tax=Cadophora gregata TaxID=51156 RepID=UPI0026DAA644|nr:uncharacterized protein ONS95_002512 [Cadophora gregata]KAK0109841.1 hypothetical protein ONS95_002512 [Cadophora gregata]KAK0110534.1 hypothetical protein ONS96_002140 [Cadophora gregata f. sp. sojae]